MYGAYRCTIGAYASSMYVWCCPECHVYGAALSATCMGDLCMYGGPCSPLIAALTKATMPIPHIAHSNRSPNQGHHGPLGQLRYSPRRARPITVCQARGSRGCGWDRAPVYPEGSLRVEAIAIAIAIAIAKP